VTTVDGLEPTETRLLLCAAIMLGDVAHRHWNHREWFVRDRKTGRERTCTAAIDELWLAGWIKFTPHGEGTRVGLTSIGAAILDEHGGKVLKRYRETT